MNDQKIYFRAIPIIGSSFALLISLVPAGADGFRDPELRAADRVSVQVLPLYAAGTDAARAGVQAERLYDGRETNGHFAGQGKQQRAQYFGVLPAFGVIRYFFHLFEISTTGPQTREPRRSEREFSVSAAGLALLGRRLGHACRQLRASDLYQPGRPFHLGQLRHPVRQCHETVQEGPRVSESH